MFDFKLLVEHNLRNIQWSIAPKHNRQSIIGSNGSSRVLLVIAIFKCAYRSTTGS